MTYSKHKTTTLGGNTMKVAYISGAARGIGRAIATEFAQKGYHLILSTQTSTYELEHLASDLMASYHIEVLTFLGDVSNKIFVQQTAQHSLEHFGRIDVLVNNAGIAHIGLLNDMSSEEWHHILEVNLSAAFFSAQAFTPTMIAQKSGSIINISSMWGNTGASCEVAYSASKGGLNSFTKALAKELAPSGILVNAIACGCIDTDMNAHLSTQEKTALCEDIPLGRFGKPQEIAHAVTFLSESNYITGQILTIDGGFCS